MGDVLGELHLYDLSGSLPQSHQGLSTSLSLVPAPGLAQPEGPSKWLKLCEPWLKCKVPVVGDGENEDPPPLSPRPELRP